MNDYFVEFKYIDEFKYNQVCRERYLPSNHFLRDSRNYTINNSIPSSTLKESTITDPSTMTTYSLIDKQLDPYIITIWDNILELKANKNVKWDVFNNQFFIFIPLNKELIDITQVICGTLSINTLLLHTNSKWHIIRKLTNSILTFGIEHTSVKFYKRF